ncbi:hypothetical protein M0638_03645 [Roseomonas sp. NAR14]|uniref:Lysozyme inhibitor LprI N-terminal domain-containing protein n=1 Tax=Roseomonas acroporae TaxID=2937791 RepID=A0A9X1Y5L0_9PROT|nr:hypothetical protein [Roseomonas acroporae]MCK8783475.1 hypothetical protein [Roseomonas acroporae]
MRPTALLASLIALPLIQACAPPPPIDATSREPRQSIADACRDAATRVVVRRDRGELLREEEAGARLGTLNYQGANLRAETDRLGRLHQRDQLMADCVRANTAAPGAGAAGTASALPRPAPPPATTGGN